MSESSLLSRAYFHVVVLCVVVVVVWLGAPALAHGESCSNGQFRTGPSTHLPDCRAYELVTPPYKDGGQVNFVGLSSDGSSLLLSALAGFSGQGGTPSPFNLYSTTRTEAGWSSVGVEPPASEYTSADLSGFAGDAAGQAADARTTVWMDRGPGLGDNTINVYKREGDGPLLDVGPALPATAPSGLPIEELTASYYLNPVGPSADGSHVLFRLGELQALYEYAGSGNATPMPVGVDDNGDQISECGTILGSVGFAHKSDHNAVSNDGGTVFFTARHENEIPSNPVVCSPTGVKRGPEVNELFARVDSGRPDAHTVAISEPTVEDCSGCDTEAAVRAPAVFLGASEDGSKVFFTTTQPLLGGDPSNNLYEYDFDAPTGQRLIRVSGGDSTVSGPVAEVVGYPQTSEDGSHAYFIARGVLTKVVNGYGQAAQPNANNLYLFERDTQYPDGRTVFIATLTADSAEILWTGADVKPGQVSAANLTPDGRFFLFTSETDLTPDDTSSAQQLFEYDAQTGALVRISVGQDGFNDDGNTSVDNAEIVSPDAIYRETNLNEYRTGAYSSNRSISANGEYVFFESSAGLTPEAFNDKIIGVAKSGAQVYALNIYEYHAGSVSLISDGRDITHKEEARNVLLLGTDESGKDVFFSTADQLVAQDTDDNVDVYDARVDGGFPAAAAAPGCSGEACQGQLSVAPTLLSPGSEFQAGANTPLVSPVLVAKAKPKAKVKPKKCKKGTKRVHGKCVKRRAKKSAKGRK